MRDIKPRKHKINANQKIKRNSQNASDILIKKIIISILILIFVGVIIFYFVQENKDPEQVNIEEIAQENIIEKNMTNKTEKVKKQENTKATTLNSEEAKQLIESKAQESITAIKNKDFKTVAKLTHPNHNLVISPYANFNDKNQSFSQNEVENLISNNTKYNWGNYNGLAVGSIEMNFSNYYASFIYDQDYANAEKISYNEDLSKGKVKNNSQSFFENSIVVEYHFSGFDPELKEKGMDWRSLRLVFIEVDGEWYLKAISHDELTI